MSRRKQLVSGFLSLAIATVLCATAAVARAADAPAAQLSPPVSATSQAVPELEQLDEIWIRGKRLSEVIRKAEDQFFKAYNKVNRNHNYDVHCGEVSLSRVSLAMIRTCLPGFHVFNYLDLAGRAVPQCETTNTSSFNTSSYSVDGYSYDTGLASTPFCTYAPLLPPALMAMEHREKYRRNVLQVINTNEQLQTMASELAGLYGEMEAVQNQYVKVRGPEQQPVQPVRKARKISTRAPSDARAGPRSM